MVRILVAERSPHIRAAVRQLLEAGLADSRVSETGHALSVLRLALAGACDVVVLSAALPGYAGLNLLRELRHARPNLPIVLLSEHATAESLRLSREAGADACVLLADLADDLIEAVGQAQSGVFYISRSGRALWTGDTDAGDEANGAR